MAYTAVAFDVETHRIRPGLLAPPLVCGSAATIDGAVPFGGVDVLHGGEPAIAGDLLDKPRAREIFASILDPAPGADAGLVIAGANIAYDLGVMAVDGARTSSPRDLMPAIFAALEQGRVYDLQIAEALDAVAEGCLGRDPRTGGPLINPETGRRGRYALATVVDLVLGRADAKLNDEFRERYGELDGIPLDQWPEVARIYPVDDARNTLEVTLAQAGHLPRSSGHKWGAPTPGNTGEACIWCGRTAKDVYAGPADAKAAPCRAVRRSRNLHDLANQVGTAWAMHLGAMWGFRVDQAAVDVIERDALEGRAEAEEPFIEAGLLKRNRDGSTSKDTSAIARRVALAYGADLARPCATCRGTRKVPSSKAKPVRCPTCRGKPANAAEIRCAEERNAEIRAANEAEITEAQRNLGRQPELEDLVPVPAPITCLTCRGEGKIPDPKALINCTDCAATGLDLSAAPDIPLTPTGKVAAGRDPLNESGDETLLDLADHFEGAKTLDVYVPYLRKGRTPAAGHADGCPQIREGKEACTCAGPYREVPLTLWPNVLLETGRTSYGDVIQLFPRKPGCWKGDGPSRVWIPSLRECVIARPGRLLCSTDFKAGELYTHAQSCRWILGYSDLGDALLRNVDPHAALAATVLGVTYEDFLAHKKERRYKDARQAAKPFTFGKPGGMGSSKLVLQQRKQGPDTPHESGPTMIDDGTGTGNRIRGYKGLRFCILMGHSNVCGARKRTTWGYRDTPIPPTCEECLACAEDLGKLWLNQWSENQPYFDYINDCVENGQAITEGHLEMWPWLRDFFEPGRLAPGEIMQHWSGRMRGGTDYCSAANGFFQGLLADIGKLALRRASRECYDRTYRLPDGSRSPLYGDRIIVFQHDELLAELREETAHESAHRISSIMVEAMQEVCPDLAATVEAPPALMRKWLKAAEPRFTRGGDKPADASDRLVPWEPKA